MDVEEQARKMAEIRSNFSRRADEYDTWIRKAVPRYDEMLDALISCITVPEGARFRAIDIGCGTGALSHQLLARHPEIELTCLDMTEGMLEVARERLRGHDQVRFVLHDLYDFQYDGPYDLVMSSLALHHLVTDEDKREQYRRIQQALAPGGSFYNADFVLASDDRTQELYMRKWTEFMMGALPREEVESTVLPRHRQEDSPAKLIDHLRWMTEAGLTDVDIIWKYYGFTVYGARKATVGSPQGHEPSMMPLMSPR